MHVVAHGSRDTDSARWAFGLESRRHIHRVPMQVSAISNGVADVDPDAEPDGAIRGLIAIMDRNLLLNLDSTADRPVYAIEYDEQGIATSLNDPAAVLLDCRVDQVGAECPEPFERSRVIQPDQAAVADHVGIDDRDQLPPIWRSPDQV